MNCTPILSDIPGLRRLQAGLVRFYQNSRAVDNIQAIADSIGVSAWSCPSRRRSTSPWKQQRVRGGDLKVSMLLRKGQGKRGNPSWPCGVVWGRLVSETTLREFCLLADRRLLEAWKCRARWQQRYNIPIMSDHIDMKGEAVYTSNVEASWRLLYWNTRTTLAIN